MPQEILRRIVVAVDESETSLEALIWTLENVMDAKTDVLMVLNIPAQTEPERMARKFQWTHLSGIMSFQDLGIPPQPEPEPLRKSRYIVEQQSKKHDEPFEAVFCTFMHPEPRDAIVYFCKEHQATVLVTGKRGIGAMKRMFTGSTSEYVVHNAPCPVLVYDKHAIPNPPSKPLTPEQAHKSAAREQ